VTAVEPAAGQSLQTAYARLPSLTGLRFVAALLVFGFHVHVANVFTGGAIRTGMEWIFGPGAGGVSFFFVLSGYVLTWSARPRDTNTQFWQRRFAKIYPNYLVTMIAAIAAVAIVGGAAITPGIVFSNVFLLQVWIPDPHYFFALNTVSWSLACEAFFYLLFPLLRRGLLRLPGNALWPATIGAFSLIWLIPVFAQALPESYQYWAIWILPVSRLPEFIAGMLLARIVLDRRWPRVPVLTMTLITAAVYLSTRWLPEEFRLVAGSAVPLALLVATIGAADVDGRPTVWRAPWAVWLGELSFAFYLVHQLVLRVVIKVAGPTQNAFAGIAVTVTALALAVAASWLLYRFVELPGMVRFGPRRRPAVPKQAT
jgi:peptidoglycan/LPS O-acetylase OafA/YrhL